MQSSSTDPIEVLDGTIPPSPELVRIPGCGAALFNPCGLAVGVDGCTYIADTGHHRICVLKDGALSVLAGSGARGCWDGHGQEAMFAHPCGLTISPEGIIFVADCGNHRIRQVTPDGEVTTLAGSGQAAHRDGYGRHACFYNPCGIAIDYVANDVLYVSDYSNNCVRAVSRSGLVSTIAKEAETPLDSPYGIAVHIESNLPGGGSEATIFVSSYHSHSLAEVSPDGSVRILAGCGAAKKLDGLGDEAAFHAPNGLAVDSEGMLYVADSGNHCLRRVTPDGEVSTVAGDGFAALGSANFNSPCGVCVCTLPGRGPVLLVADRSNSCVRVLETEALPPPCVYPSTIRKDLSSLLDCDMTLFGKGDAVFAVEGQTLRAPKALLCVRCPHFHAMFSSGMRESYEGSVKIPDVSYAAFRSLLTYLLTDEVPPDLGDLSLLHVVLELMMLANAYGVLRLEQMCARLITGYLSEANAKEVHDCAELIGECHLQRAAAKLFYEPKQQECSMAA